MRPFLFFSLALVFTADAVAAEQRFSSGETRVALIELYTSEGCSACPPAERWLGGLSPAPGLWRDFVPVAFHVNYWDRLGWPDRFATREATARQHAYAATWGSGSVYTPCFVRDGAEWRAKNPPAASSQKVGTLTLTLSDDRTARVEFSPAGSQPGENFELHLALLGSGFASKVTAGENRGETLRHEFVALALVAHPLAFSAEGVQRAEFTLPRPRITDAPRTAVALWVTRRGDSIPLQATGGWLVPPGP